MKMHNYNYVTQWMDDLKATCIERIITSSGLPAFCAKHYKQSFASLFVTEIIANCNNFCYK